MRPILFLAKGGSGSGNHGHRGRPGRVGGSAPGNRSKPTADGNLVNGLPSSANIKTAAEARAYWLQYIAGRTVGLHVRTKAGIFSVRAHFDDANTHMWTHASKPGEKVDAYDRPNDRIGPRTFDPKRAVLMDRLFAAIAKPWRIFRDPRPPTRHLYLAYGRLENDTTYVVVLTPKVAGQYDFSSARARGSEEIDKLRHLRRTLPHGGRIMKSEAPLRGGASYPVLHGLVGRRAFDRQGMYPYPGSVSIKSESPLPPPLRRAGRPAEAAITVAEFYGLFKSMPPGSRWITVHPRGDDSPGQPVLVQEEKHGVWRVIGGAGGNLNYLKLRGVRSEVEYKKEAAERAADRREKAKAERAAQKEAGTYEPKQKAREAIQTQRQQAETQFIGQVADALGWDRSKLAFDAGQYPGLSEKGLKAALGKHHRALLSAAHKAVDIQRRALLAEAAERGRKALGEIPLDSDDPQTLSVQDLDPIPPGNGLGYATDYGRRAAERGLTPEALAAEKRSVEAGEPAEQRERTEARRISAKAIAVELRDVREPAPPKAELVDTELAIRLLKAQKTLRETQHRARDAAKEIGKEGGEAKAYVLAVSGADLDEKVRRDLENDLRTLKTRAFLGEVGNVGGEDFEHSLGRHIGVGAYNSLASLSLAVTGDALVDRDVVDVLGIAGAAQVLARRLHHDLGEDEMADVARAMQEFHRADYFKTSAKALDEARRWLEAAKAVEIEPATDGAELAVAQELNAKRRDAANEARRVLGTALGEMETNAALVLALGREPADSVTAPIGNLSIDDAIRRARAIGLERGDYQISRQGANTFLTVQGQGLDRLAQPVDKAHLAGARAAQGIINGRMDEPDYLPEGFADRPDLAVHTPEGAAPRLAEPFAVGHDLAQSIRDYIGGRTADGDPPAAIVADLLSEDIMRQVGERRGAYLKALEAIAPLRDNEGKMLRAEAHTESFQTMADEFVSARYGLDRQPIHRQTFTMGDAANDALHRALAETPEGIAAYKPVGELTVQERNALRDVFAHTIAQSDETANALRDDLKKLDSAEPERETDDMFGRGTNPQWVEWKQRRDALAHEINTKALDWQKYQTIMGGPENAYAAVQDTVRSKVSAAFAHAYNRLDPQHPLKIGRQAIRRNLNHLDAVSPAAREKRLAEQRQLVDTLRERTQGRYAAGAVRDKIEAARDAQEAGAQAQMGFFSAQSDNSAEPKRPLLPDERHTIGHAAERQIAAMMPIIGRNFRAGKPEKLWRPALNGRYINQQRAIRLLESNKRLALVQGVGSGKTTIGMGAFADLKSRGKINRGLFLCPSIVQGQFQGAALNFLEPGRFRWHAEPGASREGRIAAYKDPKNDFSVVTHQAFRDDMLHLGANQAGISESEMANQVRAMPPDERRQWLRGVLDHEGIQWQYLLVDEGHNLLNRKGKADSLLADVVDSLSAETEYYVNATADPIRNDASEIYDVMRKMDPARYSDRERFMRRYGVDAPASREALRREMVRYFYPGHIDPEVSAEKREQTVQLSDTQRQRIADIDDATAKARLARMRGTVDVEAIKRLAPDAFSGAPTEREESIAKRYQQSLGILRDSALRRVLSGGAGNAKAEHVLRIANERRGKPGVVFAHSREAAAHLSAELANGGHRVVSISGADSAADKDRKRRLYKDGLADILVATDAGAVGLNAQRGQWVVQYDTPDTALVHAQRNGRIYRLGQKNNVELIDLIADHPAERRARKRLAEKYALREVMTSPLEGLDDMGIAGFLNRIRAEREARKAV